VFARRDLKRLRSAIRNCADGLFKDRLSIALCRLALDAIQNLQVCFHAPHSHHIQYCHSKYGQLMRGASLCNSFDKVPQLSHFPTLFAKSCHGRKFAVIYN
jgi:hypothetical protein